MKYNKLVFVLITALILVLAVSAFAAITEKQDSINFLNKYEGDTVTPSGYDAPSNAGAVSIIDGNYLRIFTEGTGSCYINCPPSVWENSTTGISETTGYTVEFKLKIVSDQGTAAFQSWIGSPGTTGGVNIIYIGTSRIALESGGEIDTQNNSGDFHTFRIASEPGSENKITVWRDGVLLGADYTKSSWPYAYGSFYWGDGTGAATIGGEVLVDYVRWTPGAYAPSGSASKITATINPQNLADDINKSLEYTKIEFLDKDKNILKSSILPLDFTDPIFSDFSSLPGTFFVRVSAPKWLTRVVEVNLDGEDQELTIDLLNGDINGDGVINVADYNILKTNWFKKQN